MNILVCSVDYKPAPGGIAEFTYQIARGLPKLGHTVHMLAIDREGAAEFDDKNNSFPTIRISSEIRPFLSFSRKTLLSRLGLLFQSIPALRRLYAEVKRIVVERHIEQIVCFQWNVFGVIAYLLNKSMNIPYYIVGHGGELRKRKYSPVGIVQRILYRNCSGIFVNSEYTQNRILQIYPHPSQIHISYCGVNPDEYFKEKKKADLVGKYHLENKKVLLSLTRLVQLKGIDNGIRAFNEYIKKYPDSNAVYLIAGDGSDAPRLKSIATELDLGDRVLFLGHVADERKRDYYNLADVYLMPSREDAGGNLDGFGIVFLEANCCEVPVIGGNSGGIPSAIQDGYSGLLVDPYSVDDILAKMELLLNDEEYARRLGKQGRERVLSKLTWEDAAKRFEEVLERKEILRGQEEAEVSF